MKTISFPAQRLEALFQDRKVATLPLLKGALGSDVDLTVFRKLSALPYRSSYSHRGAYYTLDTIARYDELGLWSFQDIHFSRHGTLLNTAAVLVTNASAGYFTDELDAVVQVPTKDALRQLAAGPARSPGVGGPLSLLCGRARATAAAMGRSAGAAKPGG